LKVTPTASGVPVSGNTDGSNTYKSIEIYIGFPFNFSTTSSSPVNVNWLVKT